MLFKMFKGPQVSDDLPSNPHTGALIVLHKWCCNLFLPCPTSCTNSIRSNIHGPINCYQQPQVCDAESEELMKIQCHWSHVYNGMFHRKFGCLAPDGENPATWTCLWVFGSGARYKQHQQCAGSHELCESGWLPIALTSPNLNLRTLKLMEMGLEFGVGKP